MNQDHVSYDDLEQQAIAEYIREARGARSYAQKQSGGSTISKAREVSPAMLRDDAVRQWNKEDKVQYLMRHPKFFHRALEKLLVDRPPAQLIEIAFHR